MQASTSSKIHIGEGLIKKIEKIREIAVSVFSPPESKLIFDKFFPWVVLQIFQFLFEVGRQLLQVQVWLLHH